jgi:hypothetical protein|tara:strand:+ start:249 stop:494 length:246 start_codon:yes stop_codon:yes gene_type:complete
MYDNKVLYLKTLFKKNKPDVNLQNLINATIKAGNHIEPPKEKRKGSIIDSRKFILDNAEEFLWYAIDYSMADKLNKELFDK